MRVEFHIEGGQELLARLDGMGERSRKATTVFERIGDDIRRIERGVFASGGASAGALWEADSAPWLRRKAREGKSLRTLVFTGTLEKSLTGEGTPKWSRRRVRPDAVEIGTADPVLNLITTTGPRVKVPGGARGLVGVHPEDRRRWAEWIGEWIMQGSGSSSVAL